MPLQRRWLLYRSIPTPSNLQIAIKIIKITECISKMVWSFHIFSFSHVHAFVAPCLGRDKPEPCAQEGTAKRFAQEKGGRQVDSHPRAGGQQTKQVRQKEGHENMRTAFAKTLGNRLKTPFEEKRSYMKTFRLLSDSNDFNNYVTIGEHLMSEK